jgi:hypothetical protein
MIREKSKDRSNNQNGEEMIKKKSDPYARYPQCGR